jgi:hypothetical protein
LLPRRRLDEGEEDPNILPSTVTNTEPEDGPFDRTIEEDLGKGGRITLG